MEKKTKKPARRGLPKSLNRGGTVKITGGEFKGQKIRTPGAKTHPMGERERIALFNTLGKEVVQGAFVMDLYAGSGALGIEALSRGAAFVLFIDKDRRAVETINANLEKLGLFGLRGGAIEADIALAARTATDRYPLILVDPPYDEFDAAAVRRIARLLSPRGTLVLSHPDEEAPTIKGLNLLKTSKYAAAHLSFYQKED